jgi:hypothetical protein
VLELLTHQRASSLAHGLANRMFGLVTASQIASASVLSSFCRLTYGFTYAGGINRTVCPSACSSRDQ